MKILTVVHRFPPKHHAGAELYSLRLANALARKHDVTVFSAGDDLIARNYSAKRYNLDRLRVIEVTNHRKHEEFAHSYCDPKMEHRFREILDEVEPDLIHFQHLLHHSFNYVEIAAMLGIPTVLTLHEYWMLCSRNGQMIQEDGERCTVPSFEKCARCMTSFIWGRKGLDLWMLRGIASVKKLTGLDLKAKARRIRLKSRGGAANELSSAEIEPEMKRALLFREARVRDVFETVDAVVAPSRFLRDRFAEFGLPENRIIYSDYGTSLKGFKKTVRGEEPGILRIGYLGSVQPVKGLHVLIEALKLLEPGSFQANFYGDLKSKPEYVADLRRSLGPASTIHGRADFRDIPKILADIDVLVVPSIWWENSPLVIHEAFAAGVPVVCSNIGGMAELVRDEQSGLLFEAGDASDLAAKLHRLCFDRQLLQRLSRGVPELKTIAEDAATHDGIFEALHEHASNFDYEVDEMGFGEY